MILTNREMVTFLNSVGIIKEMVLPVKASYAVSKNIKKIEKEIEAYNEERAKLLDKYGEKDEDGNLVVSEEQNIKIVPENVEKWNKDLSELLDIEVEVDIHKLKFSVLEESGTVMSISGIQSIDFMLED
ncbi:MAG: DUF1617 family protein [Clostridium sp.]|nr:DUF1617 family protein [Clostridium sp.]